VRDITVTKHICDYIIVKKKLCVCVCVCTVLRKLNEFTAYLSVIIV